ncbi:MAG: thrombospondin type 3 repeat-containing protein [Thermoplasmata archaeon]|nr:MAG: thrombospondin type 3 repeat-containing protein [Thermoplasmata archaeon]
MANYHGMNEAFARIGKKGSLIGAIILVVLMAIAPTASAAKGGEITGTVYNSNGYPVGQARVELYNYIDVDTPNVITTIQSDLLMETERTWTTSTSILSQPTGVTDSAPIFSNSEAQNTKPSNLGISNNYQNDNSIALNTPLTGITLSNPQVNDSLMTTTQPSGSAATDVQSTESTATNLPPSGSTATISSQNSDSTDTNTQPLGSSASITPQSADSTGVASQPTGASGINPQTGDTTETNSAPSGTATINSQDSNTTPTNTDPSGSTASISPQTADTSDTNSQPSGSAGITPQTNDTIATNSAPSGSATVNPQRSDTQDINTPPSGTTASISPQTSDTQANNTKPNGLIYPTNQTSVATATLTSPSGSIIISINSTDTTSTGIQPNGAPGSKSNTWYVGWFTIEGDDDGDGVYDDVIYFVLTDNTTTGVYDIMNLSYEDPSSFVDGDRSDQFLGPGNDEGITDEEVVILGIYNFTVNFTSDPSATSQDAWINSTQWYTGSFNIDVNGDGIIGSSEYVNYTLSDSDSDGIYDTIDLSTDDDVFGEGTLDDDATSTDNDEQIDMSGMNATLDTYLFIVNFINNPNSTNPDATLQIKEWYNGTFEIDADDDGLPDDVIYFVLSDMDSDGVYDTMNLSLDSTYGQGDLDDGNVTTGNDEGITASDFLTLGDSLEFSVEFDSSPTVDTNDARIQSNEWYKGNFTIDGDGDGTVETQNVYFVLSDTNSDGVYDAMDISIGDEVYGEGNVGNFIVDFGTTGNTDDELITAFTNITLGDYYQFLVDFDRGPNVDSDDASIMSTEWYKGTFALDADGDGFVDDDVYYVLSDTDSDGLYEAMDISIGDEEYDEGDVNDNSVDFGATGNTNDERITTQTDITLGDYYLFTVGFDAAPNVDTNDAQITSKEWYEGTFTIDADDDGAADDIVYFVLSDTNSNGTYDTMDISFDMTYGQGTLDDDIVTTVDDEQITASGFVTIGDSFEFEMDFDFSPVLDSDDARITSNEWYLGTFTIDGNGDGTVEANNVYYVLSDTDSDGMYEAMDISMGDQVYGEGGISNSTVDFSESDNMDDERLTSSVKIILGDHYQFTVAFDGSPNLDGVDARITSNQWYEGAFTIDADGDGLADDDVYFVLSDTDSEGLYEVMDISIGDKDYGEGDLNDNYVDFGETANINDEQITTSRNIKLGDFYNFTCEFDSAPNVDTNDAQIQGLEWFEGSFTIDADNDGAADDKVYFVLTDTDSNGTYDTMDLSLDATYGQGTLDNDNVTTGDDERITASEFLNLGDLLEFSVDFDAAPPTDSKDARIKSNEWYLGTFTIDGNGDGIVEADNVYYVLTDTNSDGIYEAMDISMGDEVYGEGDLGNFIVDFSTSDNSNDEQITATTNITLGIYFLFSCEFDSGPNLDSDDARITSLEWYEGDLQIDCDDDGLADDNVHFVLVDTDSDGLYEVLEISIGDETYGEGDLNDNYVDFDESDNTNDEQITASAYVKLGDIYTFLVEFDDAPNQDSDDIRIGSSMWYEGAFTIDADDDGAADDEVYFVLSDTDSNGIYETLDISIEDKDFGETGSGSLSDDIVNYQNPDDNNNDERVTENASMTLGDSLLFKVNFDSTPESDENDVQILIYEWYHGSFEIDADDEDDDGIQDDKVLYFLTDVNSDGLYDTMDMSINDATFRETDEGTLMDGIVDYYDDTNNLNDELITASSNITLGDSLLFSVEFRNNPGIVDSYDARILSVEWYVGAFTIDVDGDGIVNIDGMKFALSDFKSKGLYNYYMEITTDDDIFAEPPGDVGDQISQVDNDEVIRDLGGEFVVLGTYRYHVQSYDNLGDGVGVNDGVNYDVNDTVITISHWFSGSALLEGNLRDAVVSDLDSDGLFDEVYIDLNDDGDFEDVGVDAMALQPSDIFQGSQLKIQYTLVSLDSSGRYFEIQPTGTSVGLTESWFFGKVEVPPLSGDTYYVLLSDIDGDSIFDCADFDTDYPSDGVWDVLGLTETSGTVNLNGTMYQIINIEDSGTFIKITAFLDIILSSKNDISLTNAIHYGTISESSLSINLNQDGDMLDIYYALVVDNLLSGYYETVFIDCDEDYDLSDESMLNVGSSFSIAASLPFDPHTFVIDFINSQGKYFMFAQTNHPLDYCITSPDGEYALDAPIDGDYWISVGSSTTYWGYAILNDTNSNTGINIAGGDTIESWDQYLTQTGNFVFGYVNDSITGDSLEDVVVQVYDTLGNLVVSTETKADGSYQIAMKSNSAYDLVFSLQGYYTDDGRTTGSWQDLLILSDTYSVDVLLVPDNIAPTITLDYPKEGQTVGGTLIIQATAQDDFLVDLVEVSFDYGATYHTMTFAGGNTYTYSWDTTLHPEGMTRVLTKVTDDMGNTDTDFCDVYISNDVIPPSISIISPTDLEYIEGSYTIQIHATDNYALEYVNITLDGIVYKTALNPSSGYYEYAIDTTTLSDGLHTLSAEAWDYAKNSAQDSLATGFYVDNTPPTLSIYSPENGVTVYGTTIFIDVESVDPGIFSPTVQYRIDSGAWVTLSGSELLDWSDVWDSTTVSNGIHSITVRSYDDMVHMVSDTVTITVDNDDPRVTIVAPIGNEWIYGSYTFKVSASDDVGITNVYITVNGNDYSTGYNSASGLWEVEIDTTAMGDGYYSISATAEDGIPIHTQTTSALEFNVDNTEPVLSINSPLAGETVTGSTVSIDASSYDEGPFVPVVQYKIDSEAWITLTGSEIIGWTGSWDSTAYSNGIHTITFRAYDEIGHLVTDSITVTVDNDNPTVSISAPLANEYVQGVYTFKILASDDVGVTNVYITINSTDYTAGYNSVTGLWEVEIDTTVLGDGYYSITATAQDGIPSHTQVTSTLDFNVDNTEPVLSINSPLAGVTVTGSTVSIDADSFDEGPFVLVVQYKIDSGAWITLTGSEIEGWTGTWDSTMHSDSVHTITFRVYDEIGHLVSDSITVTVDNDNPTVSISAPVKNEFVQGVYTFKILASDKVGITNVTITINGDDYNTSYNSVSGLWEMELDTATIFDGVYSITATAKDGISSHTQTTDSVNFYIDNNEPTLSINSPQQGETVYGENVVVDVDSTDEGDFVLIVQFRIDSGNWITLPASWDSTAYSNGVHTITVRAYDEIGHVVTDSLTVTVDNDDPAASVVSPVANEYVQGTYTFKVSASDDVDVSEVHIQIHTDNYVMGYNSASLLWEVTIDTTAITDGTYGLSATVKDGIPIHTQTTISFNFYIDNNAPTLSVISPINSQILYGPSVALEANSTDSGIFVPTVQFRIDSGAWSALSGSEILGWTGTWDSTTRSYGVYTITFRAYDDIGHVVTESVTITVDNDYPVVSIVSPVANEYLQGTYTFGISASDGIGVSNVYITISGNDYATGYNSVSGLWEVLMGTTTFADGTYDLYATCEDIIPSHTQTTVPFSFNIDNTQPQLTIISPHSGDYVKGNVVMDIRGFDLFIDSVEYSVDGLGWVDNNTVWDTTFQTDGSHTLTFRAIDLAGHVAQGSIVVIVDNTDFDSDGIGDLADPDIDNDGVDNPDDPFPYDNTEWEDNDGDGIGDNMDLDDDNDAVSDLQDDFPANPNEWVDTDSDGLGNNADLDDDGDGVYDINDEFPLDDDEWMDSDSDGQGNNDDLDDDGDGIMDFSDAFPLNPDEYSDSDSDGIGDNSDMDADGDGVFNTNDAFPYNASETSDLDGDGIGDKTDYDKDGDGVANTYDRFPNDALEWRDTDSDGFGDNTDSDDDNDGTTDSRDVFPFDNSEWRDSDSDGLGDNQDDDRDGDGVLNSNNKDKFPDDPNEWEDTDSDGIGNNADWDDDGDGVADSKDYYPLDKSRSLEPFWWWWILITALIVFGIIFMFITQRKPPAVLGDEEAYLGFQKVTQRAPAQRKEREASPEVGTIVIKTKEQEEVSDRHEGKPKVDQEEIECPSCGRSFMVEVMAGPRMIECPHCGTSGTID